MCRSRPSFSSYGDARSIPMSAAAGAGMIHPALTVRSSSEKDRAGHRLSEMEEADGNPVNFEAAHEVRR